MKKLFSFQKRDTTNRLPKILERGTQVFVPLCPDYIPGGIADGVSALMLSALEAVKEVQYKYSQTSFMFLIADTECDILEGFDRRPIEASRDKLACELGRFGILSQTRLFSESFSDWHTLQYEMEKKIQEVLASTQDLDYFLSLYQEKRRERYSIQYGQGRRLSTEEVRALQIRHYAQYLVLLDIMHEQGRLVLMNYQTENLRALTKQHPFLPERRRLELIVY